jgi:HD-like signal output (HDOD) protein
MQTNKIDIQDLNQKMDTLFPMPQTLTKILAALNNPDTNIAELEKLVKLDTTFSFKILSLSNSAFYGASQKITNMHMALSLLGFNVIKSLAFQASTNQFFSTSSISNSIFSAQGLWKHSVGVAVCARMLSRRTKTGNAEDFFTMGILHDMGTLIESQFYPDLWALVLERLPQGTTTLFELEKEHIGMDHSSISHLLCEKWALPAHLGMVLNFHHMPLQSPEDFRRGAIILYLADKIVMQAQCGFFYPRGEEYDAAVLTVLGMDPVDLEVLLEDFQAESDKVTSLIV